jgi:hypothetical protein
MRHQVTLDVVRTRRIIKPNLFQDEYREEAAKAKGSDPLWDEVALAFDVSDITADLHVFLMDKVSMT